MATRKTSKKAAKKSSKKKTGAARTSKRSGGRKAGVKKLPNITAKKVLTKAKKIATVVLEGAAVGALRGAAEAGARVAGVSEPSEDKKAA